MAKVLDMPTERPRCCQCDKALGFHADVVESEHRPAKDGGRKRVVTVKRWVLWRGYPNGRNPLFCTLRCALDFAVGAYGTGSRAEIDGRICGGAR